jgi:carbamoyl-phosphate synthase large subunit
LRPHQTRALIDAARRVALEFGIVGAANVQVALHDDRLYVLEVNPRASRTLPFLSKCIGRPLARVATHLALGASLGEFNLRPARQSPRHRRLVAAKVPVFSTAKLSLEPIPLGPTMLSTGEAMATGRSLEEALNNAGAQAVRLARAE